ncbi:MAG: hybrid sensor histidine kinase/response regulator [Chloroflexota bacterium]
MDNETTTLPQFSQSTILIVDDNPTNLRVLLDYLKSLGFKTLIATSGDRALKQLDRFKPGQEPDLILLDVMMPGIDGFETCRQLKQNEKTQDIPVIFMTALSDTADKVKAFEVGAVDYVTKPFQQEEVLSRITAHLTIQHQKQALRELNATKDKFFSIIAHDLRGAFSVLLGVSSMFAEEGGEMDAEQVTTFGKLLNESAENTFNLLENLLQWARIQREQIEFQPQEVDLNQIVGATVSLLQHNAAQKNITLDYTVDHGTMVYADTNMVHTIYRNLISNAIKFTPKGGRITVATQPKDGQVESTVTDTGVGMTEDQCNRLFRIDTMQSTNGTSGESGTGLGLILCHEFVSKHGGDIMVKSKKGDGTTFSFTLPICDKVRG